VPEDLRALSPEATKKLLHELRVHQIELEMQNEELRTAQGRLEEARARYFELYDVAPVGYFTTNEKGIILEANLTSANLLGVLPRELRAQPLGNFIFKDDQDVYYLHRKRLFETLAPQVSELRMMSSKGTFWAHIEATVVEDRKSGKPVCRMTIHDITEHKLAGETLRESEEKYRLLADNMKDIVWLMDMNLKTTYQSPSAAKMRGFTLDELKELTVEQHLTPESVKVATEVFLREMAKVEANPDYKFSSDLELEFYRKDGTTFWSENKFSVIQDSSGKPVSMLGVARDITERKQAEEILQYSLSLLTASLESTADGLLIVDRQGKIAQWNQRFADMWKLPEKVLATRDDEKTITHILSQLADPEQFVSRVRKLYVQPEESSFDQIEFLDGRVFERYSQPQRIRNDVVGRVWSFRDITERKHMEDALRQREREFSTLVENAPDMIVRFDTGLRHVYCNRSVEKQLGRPRDAFIGKTALEAGDASEQSQFVEKSLRQTLKTGEEQIVEQSYPTPSGIKYFQTRVVPERDDKGKIESLLAITRDITERKQAEEALREEGWRLQSIIEGTHAGTWQWNVQTGETVFNETWAQITGYTLAELSPISIKTWEALVHPDDLKQSDELLERHFSGELPYYDCECRMKHKNGHWVWVHDRGRIVTRTANGKPLMMFGTHSDITDHKQLEEEKERTEKLEAVGRLAGGIAHDFNNILTAILGNISLASMEAAPGSELSVSLEQAEKASIRAKDLTVQLLTFSKGGAPVKKLGPLTELLRDTADFVLRGSNVKCNFSIPADLWHAEIDAGQVSQVVRNLVVNAQQAMPKGGTIEISAENLALTEKQSSGRGLPLRPGNYVMISVTDHGTGIPKDHLKKIFEPFFTTRPKSSGMGLATSFSIVRQHGGHLSVESKASSGSTFYVYLPTSVESAAAKQDKIEAAIRTGKARILVMDDEKTVREIAGRMLKHIGYGDVEFATDGVEAIKLYKAAMESGNPFGMAILDLTIPGGMGGEITIRNLLKIDPAVKAIVSSGYVDDPVMAQYGEYGFSGVVAKPYTIAELRKAVEDVIGGA
jgi:PAS domain S-box-containing protein